MTHFDYDENERGFLQRYGFVLGIAAIGLVVGVFIFGNKIFSGHGGPARHEQQITAVRIVSAPPSPPPQQAPPPPREDRMERQEAVDESEQRPDESPSAPAETGASTAMKEGSGPDAFGLHRGNGGTSLAGSDNVRRSHGRYGWYAAQVQSTIGEALGKNPRTRNAGFQVEIRIWSDPSGRVTRATVAGSTGDPAVDAALRNEILTGLQLQEPPPAGMKMPIVMRVTARRPGSS